MGPYPVGTCWLLRHMFNSFDTLLDATANGLAHDFDRAPAQEGDCAWKSEGAEEIPNPLIYHFTHHGGRLKLTECNCINEAQPWSPDFA